jgi:uncharacterized protein YndB with AHSA1/START domain
MEATEQEELMTNQSPVDPIRLDLTVPAEPDRAFEAFVDLGSWWPREYTWSADVLEAIWIEPRKGGLLFERGPHGFELSWGRVTSWDPPRRLGFLWQISPRREPEPDPARASEVELAFSAAGEEGTRVELEHRGFERHGDGAEDYRAALASPQGWPWMLEHYQGRLAT